VVGICFFYPFFSLESELRYSSHAMATHKALMIDVQTHKESTQKLADKLAQVVQGWQKLKDELSASPNDSQGFKEAKSVLESEQKQIEDQREANNRIGAHCNVSSSYPQLSSCRRLWLYPRNL
jgi:septal ring factor EnvC (AmiA/AmiB activator)